MPPLPGEHIKTFLGRVCPHCKTDVNVQDKWIVQRRAYSDRWLTACYCGACGSRWTTWPWLEHHTGLIWRRIIARNPGPFDAQDVATLVALKRRYRPNDDLAVTAPRSGLVRTLAVALLVALAYLAGGRS